MILTFLIIGFIAWSFVCAFQAVRKVPGRKWSGALIPGVLAITAAQAIGAFADINSKVKLEDRVGQVIAALIFMLVMAGLGAAVGWFFRPRA